jgi:hypothetical protein
MKYTIYTIFLLPCAFHIKRYTVHKRKKPRAFVIINHYYEFMIVIIITKYIYY